MTEVSDLGENQSRNDALGKGNVLWSESLNRELSGTQTEICELICDLHLVSCRTSYITSSPLVLQELLATSGLLVL